MGTYDGLRKALAGIDATAVAKPIGGGPTPADRPRRKATPKATKPQEALALFDLPARPHPTGAPHPRATTGPRR